MIVGIIDNIGTNIKIIRICRGMTQKKLGEKMGVTEASVRVNEKGRRNPKDATIKKIAAGLEVDSGILKGYREVRITEAEI